VDAVHIDAGVIAFTVGIAFLTVALDGRAEPAREPEARRPLTSRARTASRE
jgi:hypothetical protein